jgi:hypothetical protein
MKTKDSTSNFNNKLDYQDVLSNLILTLFNKEIKYDYYIPSVDHIMPIVLDSLKLWKTKSQIKKDIFQIIEENDLEMGAILRRYLWDDTVFGHEHFFGSGDFFRYRKEAKAKALSAIYSHPKLSNVTSICDKVKHYSLKKEVQDFLEILNKKINRFYDDWGKEKNSRNKKCCNTCTAPLSCHAEQPRAKYYYCEYYNKAIKYKK